MSETIKSAHTTRDGQVYLLVEQTPDWWTIKSADKIADNGQAHKLLAGGDQNYVRRHWNEFVANDKTHNATFRPSMAKYGLR